MKITVVGLGKIGLPLAVQYARKGHQVIGVDINQETVHKVNSGVEPFPGEAHLSEYLKEVVGNGNLIASVNTVDAVSKSNVVVIAVPLFVDANTNPDFSAIDAATISIAKGLQAQTLVSFETTLPIGTTRSRLTPLLENGSGLNSKNDFFVVFSPERVFTGRVFADLRRYPKLVGGINQESGIQGVKFYETVLDFDTREDLSRPNGVWNLGSCEATEMAKLAETTYRDVNIGLANQLARFASQNDIDIYKVIEACNSQPFSHIHQPGIAVGGHCIPVYPRLYLWKDPEATIVSAAREANLEMPSYAVNLLAHISGGLAGKKVAILGLSYRGEVKEHAFSGAFALVKELTKMGALPYIHDYYYSTEEISDLGLVEYELGEFVDAVILQADHADYLRLSPEDFPGIKYLVDGRNFLDSTLWSGVHRIKI